MSDVFDRLDDDERELLAEESEPTFRPPMLAVLTDERFDDPDWLFEVKLDGVRAVAVRNGDDVTLVSRREKRMVAYPEIEEALRDVGPQRLVVDGEIVAFSDGRPSFERLQGRMNVQDPEKARRTGIAVYYYLFDLLHLDGRDLRELPLRARKDLLKHAIEFEEPLRLSTHRNENGLALFEQACEQGYEGLIAKRAASRYRSTRSRDWLKFKCVTEQEFVVVGWTDPKGSRTGFGALLLGYHEDGALRYGGKVGTGFDDATLQRLSGTLSELERDSSPLDEDAGEKGAHWVEPELVAEIGFAEWTDAGRLRAPRFKGLRDDKDPADVVRERPS